MNQRLRQTACCISYKHIDLPSLYRYGYMAMLIVAYSLLLSACSEDDAPVAEIEEPPVQTETGLYTVVNISMDTLATSTGQAKTFYYSLEDHRQVPASHAQTANWDLAFLGTYNSSIAANNGTASYSPGYGGPGKGGLYLVIDPETETQYYNAPEKPFKNIPPRSLFDAAFDKVKTVPIAAEKFLTNQYLGLDHFMGSGDGYAYYDFYGEMFPQEPSEKVSHVAYAMPRTIVVRTARGNYAKVIIYSLYKNAPEKPDRTDKTGYLTFKYAIQKNGSTNLDINE